MCTCPFDELLIGSIIEFLLTFWNQSKFPLRKGNGNVDSMVTFDDSNLIINYAQVFTKFFLFYLLFSVSCFASPWRRGGFFSFIALFSTKCFCHSFRSDFSGQIKNCIHPANFKLFFFEPLAVWIPYFWWAKTDSASFFLSLAVHVKTLTFSAVNEMMLYSADQLKSSNYESNKKNRANTTIAQLFCIFCATPSHMRCFFCHN